MSPPHQIHHIKAANSWPLACLLASAFAAAVGRNGYFILCTWTLAEGRFGSTGVALFLTVVSLSELLASPIVGVLVDRWDRRLLNILSEFARAGALLVTALLINQVPVDLAIYVSTVALSITDRLSLTACQALAPTMSRACSVPTAYSMLFAVTQCGNLAAAVLAGLFLQGMRPGPALGALVIFFLISAWSLLLIGSRSQTPAPASVHPIRKGDVTTSGWQPKLSMIYALLYAAALLTSVLGASFVIEELKGDATDFAILEAAWSIGSIVGAVLLPVLRSVGAKVEFAALALSAAAMTLLKCVDMGWAFVAFFSLGAFYQLGRVSLEATLQSRVPNSALGQSKGIMHSLGVGAGMFVFAISALVGRSVVPSTFFLGFGAVLLCAMLILLVSGWKNDTVDHQRGGPG